MRLDGVSISMILVCFDGLDLERVCPDVECSRLWIYGSWKHGERCNSSTRCFLFAECKLVAGRIVMLGLSLGQCWLVLIDGLACLAESTSRVDRTQSSCVCLFSSVH